MNNIELLREFIKEIFLESNKPPVNLKKGMSLDCYIDSCKNKKLEKKANNKKKLKVKVEVPDSKGPFTQVSYKNKSYRVLTKSLKKSK